MNPKDNKAFKLKNLSTDDLLKNLAEYRKELFNLKINKSTAGVASKLSKIRVVRKGIARHLTIINEKRR